MSPLTEHFRNGTLLRPNYTIPGTAHLVRALSSLCGGSKFQPDPVTSELEQLIGQHEHYVFILVDGLGMCFLETMPEDSFLRQHLVTEMQAVFPSTTATALTTLATGEWGSQHGVTGWWMYLNEYDISTTSLHFAERFGGQALDSLGISTGQVFPVPSILPHFGHAPMSLLVSSISDTAFAKYSSGETRRCGYNTLADIEKAVADRVMTANRPTFTYIYAPQFDGLCHAEGTDSDSIPKLLETIDLTIARLHQTLGRKARIVVTADHGLIDIEPSDRVRISYDDPMLEYLKCPPVGDGRLPMFHVRSGMTDAFKEYFSGRFGNCFTLLSTDEVDKLELLGPGRLSDITRARLGSFTGIAMRPCVMQYRPEHGHWPSNIAEHAGLTPDEMRVPLIIS